MLFLRVLAVVLVLIASVTSAWADVTLHNFASTPLDPSKRIHEHDVGGNVLDAHSGNTLQVGSTFYRYGEHHACGFGWMAATPFCGFRVYSSTDLLNWTDQGYLFDASTSYWQNRCAPTGAGTGGGCFRPKMAYNAANDNYVFWFSGFFGTVTTPDRMFQLVCTSPTGGCTTQTDPTVANGPVGDLNIMMDGTDAYLIYSNMNTRTIRIVKLAADYKSVTGAETVVALTTDGGEGVSGFVRNGKYNVVWGDLCAYCSTGAHTYYAQASTPLGVYSVRTQIDVSNTCAAQPMEVDVITGGASTNYVLMGDLFVGGQNEGAAAQYHFPLTFTGDAIDTMNCNATQTVLGLTLAGTYPTPNGYPTSIVDQSTYTNFGVWNDRCYVDATVWEMQTFTPTVANLYALALPLARNYLYASPGGSGTDGDLIVAIVNLDGSKNPTTTVASSTIAASTLQWSTQWTTVVLNTTLTPGTEYGILIKGSGTTTGCFMDTISQYSNVYPSGVHRNSTNSGSTWSTNANFAAMFATYSAAAAPAAAVPFSGVAH